MILLYLGEYYKTWQISVLSQSTAAEQQHNSMLSKDRTYHKWDFQNLEHEILNLSLFAKQ